MKVYVTSTDYESPFWSKPNLPYGQEPSTAGTCDVWKGMQETPITAYNPPVSTKALGGWMSPSDARSRIALHMNWTGRTLPVLLCGQYYWENRNDDGGEAAFPQPKIEEVQAVSPLAQIRTGSYKSPTFITHGALDDLIPLDQAQETHHELIAHNTTAELRIAEKGLNLFDIYPGYEENNEAFQAVLDGYRFLRDHVQLQSLSS